jgi:hypothetical protein
MARNEAYWWINAIAIGLSLVIAGMSIGAYTQIGAPQMALVCVICQGLAIACAILGRRALTAEMPVAGALSILAALGCAWWASKGLALAWAQGGPAAEPWMVLFLAALEPGLFLLAEHVRDHRSARARAVEDAAKAASADDAHRRELERLQAEANAAAAASEAASRTALRPPQPQPLADVVQLDDRRPRSRRRTAVAAGVAAAASVVSPAAAKLPPIEPAARSLAEEMLSKGMAANAVAREVGKEFPSVTRYQVQCLARWLDGQRAAS